MKVYIHESNAISPLGQNSSDPNLPGAKVMADFKAKGIPPMKLRRMDRASRMVCSTLQPLLEKVENPEEWGLFLGTYSAGSDAVEQFLERYLREGPLGANPMLFPNTVLNAPSGQAAIFFHLKGPNSMACQNWLSGLAALQSTYNHIQMHPNQSMLSGSVDVVAPFQLKVWQSHPLYGSAFEIGEGCAIFKIESTKGPFLIEGFSQGRDPNHGAFQFISKTAQQSFLEKHWKKFGLPEVIYATTPDPIGPLEIPSNVRVSDLSEEIGMSATTPLIHLHMAMQSEEKSVDIVAGGLAGETLIMRLQKT